MGKRPRGSLPDWQPSTERQRAIVADVLAMYEQHEANDTLPRGGRGIFYDLRPNGLGNGITYRKPDSAHPKSGFGPMEAHPELVQEVILLARRAGLIPEWWVADGRAVGEIGDLYDESVEDAAATIARIVRNAPEQFHLDPQRTQPVHVEVLCEAADLRPRLARIANPYGVLVFSGSGYDGLKGKRAMAERAEDREKPTVVLHVGDRDKHGENIYRAVGEDVVAWADDEGEVAPVEWNPTVDELEDEALGLEGPSISFVRLALTTLQATALGVLDADGKAEVDAVPVQVMDGWLTDAIEALQDPACRDRHEAEQAEHRELLPRAIRDAMDSEEE